MATIQASLANLQRNNSNLGNKYFDFAQAITRLDASDDFYLSYDETEGWSTVPLNCIERFFRWAFGCYSSTHLRTIAKKLEDSPGVPLILRDKIIACWNKTYPGQACPLSASSRVRSAASTENNPIESGNNGPDVLPSSGESNTLESDAPVGEGVSQSDAPENIQFSWQSALQQHLEAERLRRLAPDSDRPLFVRTLKGKDTDSTVRCVDEDLLTSTPGAAEKMVGYYQLRDLARDPSYSYEHAFVPEKDGYSERWDAGEARKINGRPWALLSDDAQARLIYSWLPEIATGGDVITTAILPDSAMVFTELVNALIEKGYKVQEETEFTLEKQFIGRRLRVERP